MNTGTFVLEVASEPLGWLIAEYEPGKRVTRNMVSIGMLERGDVQVNKHGVVLFYDAATAHTLLRRYFIGERHE